MSCGCSNTSLPTGPAGLNGSNAFTITTNSFVQPAVSSTVVVPVSASGQYTGIWAVVGQNIYIEGGGYYEVTASTTASITVENLGYTGNASVGATVATAANVSPAGLQGTSGSGADGTTVLYNSNANTGTTAAASPQSLTAYTLPANTLGVNNDAIEVFAAVEIPTVSASNTYRVELLFGGTAIVYFEAILGNGGSRRHGFKALISRIGTSSQRINGERRIGIVLSGITANLGQDLGDQYTLDTAIDLTSNQDIRIRVTKASGSFGASEVIQRTLIVTHLKQ